MSFRAADTKQLGYLLRGYRKQQGLSQSQVAERIGLAQNEISRIETGAVSPTTDRLFKILSALNLNLVLEPRSQAADDSW